MVLAKGSEKKTPSVRDYSMIHSPLVTEKSSLVGMSGSRVVFKVDRRASKTEIRAAVERVFKVQVAKVHTLNMQGKAKKTAKSQGRRAHYKKAYVTLKEGQSIDIVEGL